MTLAPQDFIAELEQAAVAAQKEEMDFRNRVGAEIERRERDRQFAFRRVGLARAMAAAAQGAKDEDEAVERQIVALRTELGWHSDRGQRGKILQAWKAVARAIWAGLPESREAPVSAAADGAPAPSVSAAVRTFEAWYSAEIGTPFLALLDHEIPEMPVVEF